jgi:hypothetical protein
MLVTQVVRMGGTNMAGPVLLVGAVSVVADDAMRELTASLCIAEVCKCRRRVAHRQIQELLRGRRVNRSNNSPGFGFPGAWACPLFANHGDALTWWSESYKESEEQGRPQHRRGPCFASTELPVPFFFLLFAPLILKTDYFTYEAGNNNKLNQ